ncbi:hypothetical protein FC15_GL001644 [Lapidilactobacillus concavus DSM 17758]|uniref:Uncharacterized protein n=1 Tax=Lapidilactobacillus concavus DSM 17758 TaxID=1423735 RepID=A0A0R1W508_9LACO|nr:hypothetical protein FC15_GL001644 [Lapidilactobacillus concavus DSM 17758]
MNTSIISDSLGSFLVSTVKKGPKILGVDDDQHRRLLTFFGSKIFGVDDDQRQRF